MGFSLLSLRKRIWEQGKDPNPRDIAESVRDIDQAFRSITARAIIEKTCSYVVPFYLAYPRNPQAVFLVGLTLDKDPTIVYGGAQIAWKYTGDQIQVNGINGLTTGTRYVMTFEVVG
jgi:hypothetical protein